MPPPSTPTNPTPSDGATGIGSNLRSRASLGPSEYDGLGILDVPNLTWEAAGATSCEVYFGIRVPEHPRYPSSALRDVADGKVVQSRTGRGVENAGVWSFTQDSTPTPLAPLLDQQRWYWRVRAINAEGAVWGPIWTFLTASPPTAPANPQPADLATAGLNPTLLWGASVGATSYDIYFGTVNPPPLATSGHTSQSYTPAGPLSDTVTYYWKVIAINQTGSTSGPVWSFTADAQAEDDLTLDQDVTLTDVVNTTTETTVYSFTVPGGTLSTNRALRLTLIGDYLNDSGGLGGTARNFFVNVKYGGVTIGTLGVTSIASVDTRRGYSLRMLLSAAGATNAQRAVFNESLGSFTTAGGNTFDPSTHEKVLVNNNIAVDSTVNQTLQVTFDHSAATATISGRKHAVYLEKI